MLRTIFGITIALMLLIIIAWGGIAYLAYDQVEEHGGFKEAVIGVGQDARDVLHEIMQYDPAESDESQ